MMPQEEGREIGLAAIKETGDEEGEAGCHAEKDHQENGGEGCGEIAGEFATENEQDCFHEVRLRPVPG